MVVEYTRYGIDRERAQAGEEAYRRAAAALEASMTTLSSGVRETRTTMP
jgi:hypothetical protein